MSFLKVKCKVLVGERWVNSWSVKFPVSYKYNGGIVVDGEWYDGYEVETPNPPEGFEFRGLGIGLDLNSRPPMAMYFLKPLDGHTVSRSEVDRIVEKLNDSIEGQ